MPTRQFLASIGIARDPSDPHHSTAREGITLGLIVGVFSYIWVLAFDATIGKPFETFHILGGPVLFTILHFVLCIAYGLAIIALVHAAMESPSVVFAMIFGTILFQAAFVMLTAFLASLGVGELAWGRFLLGNVLTAMLTLLLLTRRHHLRDLFHAAETNLDD